VTSREQFPGHLQSLVNRIVALEEQLEAERGRAFRVPVVDADPDPDDPTNLWLFADGRLRARLPDGTVVDFTEYPKVPILAADPTTATGINMWLRASDRQLRIRMPNGVAGYTTATAGAGTTTGSAPTTSSKPKPARVQRKTYRTTWDADWSQSYRGGGAQRTDDDNLLYYGRISSVHDEQKSMIGFPHGSIQAALSGASIRKVEFWMNNLHAYFNAGVDVHFGAHGQASKPGSYSIRNRNVTTRHFGKPQAKWVTLSNWFGTAFRDGLIKGVNLDQPGTSLSYYGYAAGVGSGRGTPRLRITYVK